MANKNFEFSWEFKNFCVRTVHENWEDRNSPLRKNCPVELIKYFDEKHKSCYVVAWFELDDEGYELHFVGNRPMVDIEPEEMKSIWAQLQAAQKMLDAFTKYMDDNGFEKNKPYMLFMSNPCTSMVAEGIEELYVNFKIFVDGFCNQDIDMEKEL